MFFKKFLSFVTVISLFFGSVYFGGSLNASASCLSMNEVTDISDFIGGSDSLPDALREGGQPEDEIDSIIDAPTTAPTKSVEELTRDLNLTVGVITSHVSFYGHSLEGLTLEEALEKVNEWSSELNRKNITVYFEDEHTKTFKPSDLDITISDEGLEEQLSDAVLEGDTVMDRYKFAKNYANDPLELALKIEADSEHIDQYLTKTLSSWNAEPSNATISYRDGERSVEGGVTGEEFDFTSCAEKITEDFQDLSVLDVEKYKIEADCEVTKPSLTKEEADQYTLIGTFTTSYDAPTTHIKANREENLNVSISNMNGHVFQPGETVSALTMYKDITAANGYKAAGTIMGGAHVDAIGGGICQTTTTLYNAVLMAELEVVYRHNHSMMVTYVPFSQDAMVYYEGWDHESTQYDFVFKNTTSGQLFIESYITKEDCTITVNLIGIEEHAEGHSVEYVSETIGMSAPALNLIVDPNLTDPPANGRNPYYLVGQSSPLPGVHSRLWKVTYENGKEVSRELVNANDHYNPQTATFAIVAGGSLSASIGGSIRNDYIILHYSYNGGESEETVEGEEAGEE